MGERMSDVQLVSFDRALPISSERRLDLPVDRAALWQVFGDNPRFSKLIGEPAWQLEAIDPSLALFTLRGRLQAPDGHTLRIEVEPHQWIRGRLFAGPKRFVGLPIDGGVLSFEFSSQGPARTQVDIRLRVYVEADDGHAAAQAFCHDFVSRCASALAMLADGIARGLPDPYCPQPPADAEAVRARAQRTVADLVAAGADRAVLDRLVEYIATSDEVRLARMRPGELAARWGLSADLVLRTLLRAARAGLVDLLWDILCPTCRGTATRQPGLDSLQAHSHCGACVAGYDVEFDRLVEVTFRPAAWLRLASEGVYCQAGPSNAPHVEAQLVLKPGVARTVELDLPAGTYSIWVQRGQAGGYLQVTPDGPACADLDLLDEAGAEHPTATLRSGGAQLTLRLQGPQRRLVLIEQSGWINDLTSAAKLTSLQEFRDLYPRTAVAAGQRIRVGHMAFLFSDLKGSTAMFEQLGDGPAYGQVHDHFEFLTQVIREHDGAVVKTIGDAIMAVFTREDAALSAALSIQRRLPQFNALRPDVPPLAIKLGVHAGPCVVTNANELLDYFGTTVNLAARVQSQSYGGDVVLLSRLLADPAVAAVAGDTPREQYETTLAGLQSRYQLTRLRPS